MDKKLLYDVSDKPKFGRVVAFAFQQLLAILAATIAVPTIIGLPTQIPAAIIGAGVGTLVYQISTKFKSPVFLGSSFAFINSLIVALSYGYMGIVLGSVVAGLVYVAIAVAIRFVGTSWVDRLMPPVIVGPVVALIGLTLAGSAMTNIISASSAAAPNNSYNLLSLLCGVLAFGVIIICSTQKKFTLPKLIPFVLGILAGYALAAVFTVIGFAVDADYMKIVDFSPVVNNFVDQEGNFRGLSAFIQYPRFSIVEAIKELATGKLSPEVLASYPNAVPLTLGGAIEVVMAFLPVALVTFAEHIADHKNLSSIIGHDLIRDPGLGRTLMGDGVGSISGTLFGVCPNTTYGESVGCVAITGNASVITITTTAVSCIILSFVSPVMAALQTIPPCVMGGVCLSLYGFIAVSGLKMFQSVDLNDNKNVFVIASILVSGLGGLSIKIPYAFAADGSVEKFVEITTIATALIIGVLTNWLMTHIGKGEEKNKCPDE